jgi:hypothetical protein
MLSGRRPFTGTDVRAVVMSVLSKPPPSLRSLRPDLPPIVERIVTRAMDRERHFRYRSAAELQKDLLEAKAAIMRRPSSHHDLVPFESDEYEALETEPVGDSVTEFAGAGGTEWDAPTVTLRPSSRSARQKRPA